MSGVITTQDAHAPPTDFTTVEYHGGIPVEEVTNLAAEASGVHWALVGINVTGQSVLQCFLHTFANPLYPGKLLAALASGTGFFGHLSQNRTDITDGADLNWAIAPDLGLFDINLDPAAVVAEQGRPTETQAEIQPSAQNKDDVGQVGTSASNEPQGVICRKGIADEWYPGQFDKLAQFFGRLRPPESHAADYERTFGLQEKVYGLTDPVGVSKRAGGCPVVSR
jgi:hypothetical protein